MVWVVYDGEGGSTWENWVLVLLMQHREGYFTSLFPCA